MSTPASAVRDGSTLMGPQNQDIQFRDDGFIPINMSSSAISDKALRVVSALFEIFGNPIDALSSRVIPRTFRTILEKAELTLAQQTQDISQFIAKYSQEFRKALGLPVDRPELRNEDRRPQPVLSFPPRSRAELSQTF